MSMKQGFVRSTSLVLLVALLVLGSAPAFASPAAEAPSQATSLVTAFLDWVASLGTYVGWAGASAGIDPDGAPAISGR